MIREKSRQSAVILSGNSDVESIVLHAITEVVQDIMISAHNNVTPLTLTAAASHAMQASALETVPVVPTVMADVVNRITGLPDKLGFERYYRTMSNLRVESPDERIEELSEFFIPCEGNVLEQ